MLKMSDGNLFIPDTKSNAPVKFSYPEVPIKKQPTQYPCLCKAISRLLFLGRISGILPIIPTNHRSVVNQCRFNVSDKWTFHSIFLQFIYILYFAYAYGYRLFLGPPQTHQSEWYIMTIAYTGINLECIVILLSGTIFARRICNLLEKLSIMPGRISEMRILHEHLKIIIIIIIACNLAFFGSYIIVFYIRFKIYFANNQTLTNDILDSWISVLIRGFTTVFPTLQVMVSLGFYSIIWRKFEYLATIVYETINKLTDRYKRNNRNPIKIYVTGESIEQFSGELEHLTEFHRELHANLKELNQCTGVQLLMIVCASLFTSICNCYRYAISTNNSFTSNEQERLHYVFGVVYPMSELIIYMVIGQMIYSKSLQPLHIIQDSRLVNLPTQIQQQIQTLLLQWNGKNGYLCAFGIIKIGPWLLPPIIGNVITYLLVALQFSYTEKKRLNVTATSESI